MKWINKGLHLAVESEEIMLCWWWGGGGTTQLGLDLGEGVRMGDLFAKQAFFARIEIAAGGAVVAHLSLGIDQNLATVAAKLDH